MHIIVRILKACISVLPRSLRGKASQISALVSLYRRFLYTYYFDSYNYDSDRKREDYRAWISSIEARRAKTRAAPTAFHWILVVRVDSASINQLGHTLDSVNLLKGGFPKLVLQFSGVGLVDVKRVCESLNKKIVVIYAATDSLRKAEGGGVDWAGESYVSVIYAGDKIAAAAYECLGHHIKGSPEATVFYSDHDYLDGNLERHHPQFKPQWNYDLLLTYLYVKRSVIFKFKKNAVLTLLESMEDLDYLWGQLILYTAGDASLFSGNEIRHVPEVLFHLTNKGALGEELPAEWRSFLSQHLGNAVSRVEFGESKQYLHIDWVIPSSPPLVSIVIPTRNGHKLLRKCMDSIFSLSTYTNFEILLVDNQSTEMKSLAYFEQLGAHPKVRVLAYDAPFNYSALNNFAVQKAKGELVALVNNDIEVIEGNWLQEMVGHALRPGVGCVGAKLLYGNSSVQHGGVTIGYGGVAGHSHKSFPVRHPGYMNRLVTVHNVSAVTAACLVVRKAIYVEVGGLNEKDLTVAFNDVDFCLRVQEAGYRNVFTPHAVLYHHESVSRGSDQTGEKYERFQLEIAYMKKRWKTDVTPDPAYNPNLTLSREDFSLRFEDEC